MSGTFIIRPIEANLTHNTDLIGKMNPYLAVVVGNSRIKGQICKKGGKHPHWNDAITIPYTNESQVLIELMDKDKISHDDNIGSFVLDLHEVQASGQVSKWYPLTYKNKSAGEILIETVFQSTGHYQEGQQYTAGSGVIGQNQYYEQERVMTSQPEVIQREEIITTTTSHPRTHVQEEVLIADTGKHSNVWTEQRQVVEPHTFMKEVEVVETRSAMKDIEVMEPVRVMKDVQYTQAVPVKKQIEVMEPQVVMKEVEVIEPRLVTKTIQVVENVPVTRQVEVIEMRNTTQEVNTMEPQTFTKQVEVTEYVPVTKQVQVSQPVTVKKAVEFVEPVITTQTITKELKEAVIIGQEVTTSVGPASVVGMSQEYGYVQHYGEISSIDRERLAGHKRWIGYETIFTGLNDQERLFEQQRLSRLNDQEWHHEQQRLMGFNEQQRLLEQRKHYNNYYTTTKAGGLSSGHKRHHGFEKLFHGLNEKESQFEVERWNRLSEQEWLQEQQRLGAFNNDQRLVEQRRLYNNYVQNGGFNTYNQTATTSVGGQNLHSNTYHQSPNF